MNYKPTDTNVKFVEYNNSGDGAIADAVNGMTLLDASKAANYSNINTVFGKSNGVVSYSSDWNPIAIDKTKNLS